MNYKIDWEQKYKIALSRARVYSEHPLQDYSDKIVKWIFPELKENDDEKIIKGIKSLLEHYKESGEAVCPYPFVSIKDCIAWLEKQGEQKPSDKVEPKFKVGDWVILPLGIIAHIDSLNSTDYQVTTTDGKICNFKISKQDNYRFWTINEAKEVM